MKKKTSLREEKAKTKTEADATPGSLDVTIRIVGADVATFLRFSQKLQGASANPPKKAFVAHQAMMIGLNAVLNSN